MSITIQTLTRRYGAVAAVNALSVDIPTGCFFSVLGPSGCGKSTLLRMIAGLEPVDAGTIALAGRPVAGPGLHLPPEARGVGVVFQSYALWPHMDVLDNVAFPIEAAGTPRRAARAAATQHLVSVDLAGYADRRPADLSGGQRQRVALARCLAARARIVLMDEPLANLDPHLRAAMEQEMAAFHARAGATTLFITHDQREAMALSDLVAVMRAGRFEQVAAPQDLHDRPATAFVAGFIGRGVLVPGVVTAVAEGRAAVRLAPDLQITVRASATAPSATAPGTTAPGTTAPGATAPGATAPGAATVLLRPGDLRLDPAGLPADVLSCTYRGDHWEARVQLPGIAQALILDLPQRAPVGAALRVAIGGGWTCPGLSDPST